MFSAALSLANNLLLFGLNPSLLLSCKVQLFPAELDCLNKTKAGLKPQNKNGPSLDPLPTYEPNLLKPCFSAKQ